MFAKKDIKLNYEKIMLIIAALIILVIHLRYINRLYLPYLLDDEFGYWSNAAYFVGFDWSNAIMNSPYYSFGYSFILAPLILFLHDPVTIYRAAIVVNAILMTASFFLSFSIAKTLAPSVNRKLLVVVVLCVSLYPGFLTESQFALGECLLLFICWLLLWCFLELSDKSPIGLFMLIGVLPGYAFMIHQRTLGVICAAIIVIILMKVQRKIYWKQLIAFFVPLGIMLIVYFVIKHDLRVNLWAGSSFGGKTDFSGQISKLQSILTTQGFIRLFCNLIGHIFYIGAATFMVGYLGVYKVFRSVVVAVIGKRGAREKKDDCEENNLPYFYFNTFLLTAFISLVGISAVFMMKAHRIDTLMYGRYMEILLVPMLLIGILHLITSKKNYKGTCAAIVVLVATGYISNLAIHNYPLSGINPFSIVALTIFYKDGAINIFQVILVTALGGSVLYLLLNRSGMKGKIAKVVILLLLCCVYFFDGNFPVKKYVLGGHVNNIKLNDIVNYLDQMDTTLPVYYIMTGTRSTDNARERLQFLMRDKLLYCISSKEMNGIKGDAYIIAQDDLVKKKLTGKYTEIKDFGKMTLLKTSEGEQKKLELMGFSDIVDMKNVEISSDKAAFSGDSNINMTDKQTRSGENIEIGMELWLNGKQTIDDARIITKFNGWQKDMSFFIASKKDKLGCIFSSDGVKGEGLFLKTDAIPADQWNNLRITFKNGLVRVYLNDILQGEKQLSFSKIFVGDTKLEVGKNMEGQIRKFYYKAD